MPSRQGHTKGWSDAKRKRKEDSTVVYPDGSMIYIGMRDPLQYVLERPREPPRYFLKREDAVARQEKAERDAQKA